MNSDIFDQREKARDELTPNEGWNVVALDDYEEPGDELSLVSEHDTKAEAEEAQRAKELENPGTQYLVYGRKDRTSVEKSLFKSVTSPGSLSALRGLLAQLQAFRECYQALHWAVAGQASFADHLLYERLYNDVVGEVDGLAEKLVGLSGDPKMLSVQLQAPALAARVAGMQVTPAGMLSAEVAFCEQGIPEVKALLLSEGELGEGLENYLQGLADAHEGHVYLLTARVSSE